MKRINQLFISTLAATFFATCISSCVDDELVKIGNVVEGEPVTMSINLSFVPQKDVVVTKADNSLSGISDLTLFIYSGNGTFQQVLSTEDGLTFDNSVSTEYSGTDDAPGGRVRGKVTFETTSGTKQLLAVANMELNPIWSELRQEAMNGTLSFDELKAEVMNMSTSQYANGSMSRPISITGTGMVMTGWNTGVVFSPSGTISNYGERGVDSERVVIRLDRSLARITFNIPAAPANAKRTFTPTSYRIYNIPIKTYLTNTNYQSGPAKDGEFVNTETANIGTASGEGAGTYSFTFYMPENIYEKVENVTDYKQRDTWKNGSPNATTSPETKEWEKAPQTSTFVVISGTYVGTGTDDDGTSHNYTGNVSYTVHLGDFSNDQWGDYSVKRNWSYTYNMSVLGVDNIVVEVEAKGDDDKIQQGAEGNIFDYTGTTYSYALDAHYEQVFLEYDLTAIANSLDNGLEGQDLDDAIANNLILVIQSEAMDYTQSEDNAHPYSVQNKRGTLRPYKIYADAVRGLEGTAATSAAADAKTAVLAGAGTGAAPTKGFDYKWIEFWPQKDANTLAAYPGVSTWSKAKLTGLKNQEVYGGNPSGDTSRLKDVYDIIVGMGKAVKKIYQASNYMPTDPNFVTNDNPNSDGICIVKSGSSYVARFTAFVNEYFYYEHPLTGSGITSWDVFVNKIPREMIIAMSTKRSPDGNSSLSRVYSYISQVSMETFYNSRKGEIDAFGIETYNETPNYLFGSPTISGTLSPTDGWENQNNLLASNNNWSKYISYANNGWTNTVTSDRSNHKLVDNAYATKAAYSACMSRNRDLNGNGKIDENEIRWYLPSANEYVRIGVGSNALSNAAQLYTGNKDAMKFSGYPEDYIEDGALYYTSSAAYARLYWAVERGSYGQDGDWAAPSQAKPIRCIRALPAEKNDHDISTVHVASEPTYEDVTEGNGIITLKFADRLVDGLYRDPVLGSGDDLKIHDEDDEANRFSKGIFVAQKYQDNTNYRLGDLIGYKGTATGTGVTFNGTKLNPCSTYEEGGYKTGWRVPNQVELSAMLAAGYAKIGETVCCTQFSNLNVRFGFAIGYDSGSGNYILMCPGENNSTFQWAALTSGRRVRCVRDVPNGYFDN